MPSETQDTTDRRMMAVVTTGNGGFDKLDYRSVPGNIAKEVLEGKS